MKHIIMILLLCCTNLYSSVIKETDEITRLLDSGKYTDAFKKVESMGNPAEKHFWMSRYYFYKGEYREAYDEISKAIESDGAQQWWPGLQNYYYCVSEITNNFTVYSSTHFVFKASGKDVLLAPYALNALEKAYRSIGESLGCFPEGKILVEVYGDRKMFSTASTLSEDIIEKTGTVGICKFNRLMILSPRALPLGYSWLDTLSHEYIHYVVNHKSLANCPLWLHEGIARYHETLWAKNEPDVLSQGSQNILIKARKDKMFVPFEKMSPSLVYLKNQEEIMLAFAEVSVGIEYLKKTYGKDVVKNLLDNISKYPEGQAVYMTTGMTIGSFEKRLKKYIVQLDLKESQGAVANEVDFAGNEHEFVGTDAKGSIRLGDQMRRINRFDAAVVQYKKALDSEPSNPAILLKLARSYMETGSNEEAEKYLLEAVKTNPHYVTPHFELGNLYYKQGKFDEALKCYQNTVAINPFIDTLHDSMASCYAEQNDKINLELELKAMLALNPNNPEIKVILQRMEATKQQKREE